MLLINCIVLLSILGHIILLTTKTNYKELIYGLSTLALFLVWSMNGTLSIPSAFAIFASIMCVFKPQHTHCWTLISILCLAIFIFFLLNKPKILEGHIFGIHPQPWITECSLSNTSTDCSSLTQSDSCDQCGSNDCFWVDKLSKCVYLPSDLSNNNTISGTNMESNTKDSNAISPSSLSDSDNMIELSGNVFSTDASGTDASGSSVTSSTSASIFSMSSYCTDASICSNMEWSNWITNKKTIGSNWVQDISGICNIITNEGSTCVIECPTYASYDDGNLSKITDISCGMTNCGGTKIQLDCSSGLMSSILS